MKSYTWTTGEKFILAWTRFNTLHPLHDSKVETDYSCVRRLIPVAFGIPLSRLPTVATLSVEFRTRTVDPLISQWLDRPPEPSPDRLESDRLRQQLERTPPD